MTRREEIENIIIGTLLESNERKNFYEECRCAISSDMFENDINRSIYDIIVDMNMRGAVATDPHSIFMAYGDKVLDILPTMLELVTDFSFIHKKMEYNEKVFRHHHLYGEPLKYAEVTFTDYVNLFLKLVYSNEKRENKNNIRTAAHAA